MTDYEVYKDESLGYWRIRGLRSGRADGVDQVLVHHIPYPDTETPEVETDFKDSNYGGDKPRTAKDKMHGALYDLYQWKEGLKEGDRFITPFGNFRCVSFHVVEDQ